jgi:hypothetical protein
MTRGKNLLNDKHFFEQVHIAFDSIFAHAQLCAQFIERSLFADLESAKLQELHELARMPDAFQLQNILS